MQKVIFMHELPEYSEYIDASVIEYIADGQIETYESFEKYDLIAFDWYDLKEASAPPAQILIYVDADDIFYICENETSYAVARRFFIEDVSNERCAYLFFKDLLRGGVKYIEQLENRVARLDDDVSDGTESGLRENIIETRNEILRAEKYYAQLEFLFDEICENDNDLFSDEILKYFEVIHNRSVRLASLASGLREYITQVRESYQSQIGIEQNNLMKVFTMVTSIFLPLTLIIGWHGMNLKMPEFGWRYGYVFVAGLSVAVCIVWFILFKKKRWFK